MSNTKRGWLGPECLTETWLSNNFLSHIGDREVTRVHRGYAKFRPGGRDTSVDGPTRRGDRQPSRRQKPSKNPRMSADGRNSNRSLERIGKPAQTEEGRHRPQDNCMNKPKVKEFLREEHIVLERSVNSSHVTLRQQRHEDLTAVSQLETTLREPIKSATSATSYTKMGETSFNKENASNHR